MRTALSKVQSSLLATGSIPAVGSSNTMNFHEPDNAMDTDSLRFWPPDNSEPKWWALSDNRKTSSSESASLAAETASRPLSWPKKATCSLNVKWGNSTSCCGQTPSTLRKEWIASGLPMSLP